MFGIFKTKYMDNPFVGEQIETMSYRRLTEYDNRLSYWMEAKSIGAGTAAPPPIDYYSEQARIKTEYTRRAKAQNEFGRELTKLRGLIDKNGPASTAVDNLIELYNKLPRAV